MDITIAQFKTAARVLREDLRALGPDLPHSQALELVAHQGGMKDWNTAAAILGSRGAGLAGPVPVLRIQDEAIARDFYVGYLGFHFEWEHRFEAGLPLYARIRRDGCVLDISGHHGDGTPGSAVRIPLSDVRSLHKELKANKRTSLRPNIDRHAPGGATMDMIDPFGNILRFCQSGPRLAQLVSGSCGA